MKRIVTALLIIICGIGMIDAEAAPKLKVIDFDPLHLPEVLGVTSGFQFTRNLTIGSTGADVVELQVFLEEKGFLVMEAGVPKGYFGATTKSALAAFQASVGLEATGYFGPLTIALANSMIGAETNGNNVTDENFKLIRAEAEVHGTNGNEGEFDFVYSITAKDGDVYIKKDGHVAEAINASNQEADGILVVTTSSDAGEQNGSFVIEEGETKMMYVKVQFFNESSNDTAVFVRLKTVLVGEKDSTSSAEYNKHVFGSEYKTNTVLLKGEAYGQPDEDELPIDLVAKLQNNAGGSAFLTASIKGFISNKLISMWKLSLSCDAGVLVYAKDGKTNICGNIFPYYGDGMADRTKDYTMLTSGVQNTNEKPKSINLVLKAFNQKGEQKAEDKMELIVSGKQEAGTEASAILNYAVSTEGTNEEMNMLKPGVLAYVYGSFINTPKQFNIVLISGRQEKKIKASFDLKNSLQFTVPSNLKAGTYTLYAEYGKEITKTNSIRVTVSDSKPVKPIPPATPKITVTYPNGGEIIGLGEKNKDFRVTWKAENLKGDVGIYIHFADGGTCYVGKTGVAKGMYTAKLGANYQCPNLPRKVVDGSDYRVSLYANNNTNADFVAKDSSDGYITVRSKVSEYYGEEVPADKELTAKITSHKSGNIIKMKRDAYNRDAATVHVSAKVSGGAITYKGTWTFDHLGTSGIDATISENIWSSEGTRSTAYTFATPGVWKVTYTVEDRLGARISSEGVLLNVVNPNDSSDDDEGGEDDGSGSEGSGSSDAKVTITTPTSSTSVKAGATNALRVRGAVEHIPNNADVSIELLYTGNSHVPLRKSKVYTCIPAENVCIGLKAAAGLAVTIPKGTPAGPGYRIKVDVTSNGVTVSDTSEPFTIIE